MDRFSTRLAASYITDRHRDAADDRRSLAAVREPKGHRTQRASAPQSDDSTIPDGFGSRWRFRNVVIR